VYLLAPTAISSFYPRQDPLSIWGPIITRARSTIVLSVLFTPMADTTPKNTSVPPASAGAEALVRADGLWFNDCGLIIQAENTIFRVSGDFLAARSPVFADMLALPRPQDAALLYGCLVVHLPDSASDTTVFLKALIYSEYVDLLVLLSWF
jgi:hypothetical protein